MVHFQYLVPIMTPKITLPFLFNWNTTVFHISHFLFNFLVNDDYNRKRMFSQQLSPTTFSNQIENETS